jgi:hypothetical protein
MTTRKTTATLKANIANAKSIGGLTDALQEAVDHVEKPARKAPAKATAARQPAAKSLPTPAATKARKAAKDPRPPAANLKPKTSPRKPQVKDAADVLAVGPTLTEADIEAMTTVERVNGASAELHALRIAQRKGDPKPATPIRDWFAKYDAKDVQVTRTAKRAKTAKGEGRRTNITNDELRSEIEAFIDGGMTIWSRAARALSEQGKGRSTRLIKAVFLEVAKAKGVTVGRIPVEKPAKAAKAKSTPAKAAKTTKPAKKAPAKAQTSPKTPKATTRTTTTKTTAKASPAKKRTRKAA